MTVLAKLKFLLKCVSKMLTMISVVVMIGWG